MWLRLTNAPNGLALNDSERTVNITSRGVMAFCNNASTAAIGPTTASVRQMARVLPPAAHNARVIQNASAPSATVASAHALEIGSSDSERHPLPPPVAGANASAEATCARCGDSALTTA